MKRPVIEPAPAKRLGKAGVGSAANLGPVIDFADAAIVAMAVINITALYCLMGIVKKELTAYTARLAAGEITEFTS